ncbi:hypothetical protein HKBW3S43_01109 [Candidatus Hakubella thermalkaliphila]|uniref:4Fe-4S ferredoxin-type domain-containing protein n=1 Tax=Candidatus Hakubella thermalkaliphila TaxID=2754717 RepID=A0A6V8QJ60_9ACTN|nr:4Fe-4S dicluster domain-containing protein [Candidatus Hakubella thermalkaliphila]GFP28285.1 hypothetical protein HKBW3S33_01700 [Candidatus Hakubella thermalkaliphila]GFP35317.1 hypothetical protein HKBW3S43_01109 [Candidatus Hakubella thermalkaliphila]GFP43516.1 hypothetical protein HKBW3C_02646 [Candidatus Hakubella thermalkaliphila]
MQKFLISHIEKCTGCARCLVVCSALKEGQFIPFKSRVHFVNFARDGFSVPNICFHCEEPACQEACPVEAISRDEWGAVVVDDDTCTGCDECVDACPYGMIDLNGHGLAYKCDLCSGDPECVKVCQPQAIVYAVLDEEASHNRIFLMKQQFKEGTAKQKRLSFAHALKGMYG